MLRDYIIAARFMCVYVCHLIGMFRKMCVFSSIPFPIFSLMLILLFLVVLIGLEPFIENISDNIHLVSLFQGILVHIEATFN